MQIPKENGNRIVVNKGGTCAQNKRKIYKYCGESSREGAHLGIFSLIDLTREYYSVRRLEIEYFGCFVLCFQDFVYL